MRYSLPPKPGSEDAVLDETSEAAAPPPRSVSAERPIAAMPEVMQRRITTLYEKLGRIDHYRLLGVAATDDVKTIKRAYFALAKEHHPDRWFRKDIGALRAKVEAIFEAMTRAEATLTNARKRAEYDAYLRDVLKTRFTRRQAEAFEGSREWRRAAEAWARVVEQLPTDAWVQHRYACALLRAGSIGDAALAAATRAIELDSTRAEYRLTAAQLHLAEGRDRSALAQLAVACEIDPDRTDLAGLHAALVARVASLR
jgi:tetratricopeptide (TPR) repeat protein